MKQMIYKVLGLCLILIYSSTNAQQVSKRLSAIDFEAKIKTTKNAVVLDVRTPEEYAKGHVPDAINDNLFSKTFLSTATKLDKSKTFFVYCLSGGRSAKAVKKLQENGFKHIIELDGGIVKWRANNLPEVKTTGNTASGLTLTQYNALINSQLPVLVDFYAKWCGPCQKMEPYLNKIGKTLSDKMKLIRIDFDANQQLMKDLKITELPILRLYKNNKIIWQHNHFISEAELMKKLHSMY